LLYLPYKLGNNIKRLKSDNNKEQLKSDNDLDFNKWLLGEYKALYSNKLKLTGLKSGGDLELQSNSAGPKSNGNLTPKSDKDLKPRFNGN